VEEDTREFHGKTNRYQPPVGNAIQLPASTASNAERMDVEEGSVENASGSNTDKLCEDQVQQEERRITVIRKLEISFFDNILLPFVILSYARKHAPQAETERVYSPESQERVEVGSADGEASPPGASPPPGSAWVDCP